MSGEDILILVEGYDDRAFFSGMLQSLGCLAVYSMPALVIVSAKG